MKRAVSLLLILVLAAGILSACGKAPVETSAAPSPTEAPAAPSPAEATPAPTPETPDFDPAELHPMLWKVTDDQGHSLYLFGTIHVGDGRNEAVLNRVSPILLQCDALAVEFDAVAYQEDASAMMQDMLQFVYTDGGTVRDHMPPELYERAAALLTEARVYSPMLDSYNLGMWSQLLSQAAMMTRSPLDPTMAMDTLLINRAYEHELPVLSLESPSFQYGLLNSFSDELNLLSIESTLDSLDDYGRILNDLYTAWLSGDDDAVLAALNEEDAGTDYTEEQQALVDDYNRAMLDDRNRGMAEAALGYLAGGDTVFLAVGTAHMLEEAGLVQLLTDAGCSVERVDY